MRSGFNIRYVSDAQMVGNVVNGIIGVSVHIWFYVCFSAIAGISSLIIKVLNTTAVN